MLSNFLQYVSKKHNVLNIEHTKLSKSREERGRRENEKIGCSNPLSPNYKPGSLLSDSQRPTVCFGHHTIQEGCDLMAFAAPWKLTALETIPLGRVPKPDWENAEESRTEPGTEMGGEKSSAGAGKHLIHFSLPRGRVKAFSLPSFILKVMSKTTELSRHLVLLNSNHSSIHDR